MYLNRGKVRQIEQQNVHRWLVSYADYMTLLFALFVVLYAMALVNEKPFDTISKSFSEAFMERPLSSVGTVVLNPLTTSDIKTSDLTTEVDLLRPAEKSQLTQIKNAQQLSNIHKQSLGVDLSLLQTQLNKTLEKLFKTGFVKLHSSGDWLEIELSSGLLFASGSSAASDSAKVILAEIFHVISDSNNYIRVRGYTDNQVIRNEIFSSNWELSVFRATAILKELETLGITAARMAIEGYGQYYPSADNLSAAGRSKNRRVVIAISKYGLVTKKKLPAQQVNLDENNVKNKSKNIVIDNDIKVIKLESGGILITSRPD